jgi:soluble lytic murein transglycosylase-like protein
VTQVNKEAKKTKDGFKEFAGGAADEVGKLVPGVDKVTSAVRLMGTEFAVASVAVAALAVGVKSVMALREQYGQQRIEGREAGVSSLRMEEYQRKFVKTSGGTVDRTLAASEVMKLSGKMASAYADPGRMGTDARQLRMLGIDVGERGKGITPINAAMTRLGDTFSKMKPEQVMGIAKSIGMNQDFALSLAKMGDSVGKVTEQTAAEIQKRNEAQTQLNAFNNSFATLTEKFREAENELGQKLLPSFTKFIELVSKLVAALPNVAEKGVDVIAHTLPSPISMANNLVHGKAEWYQPGGIPLAMAKMARNLLTGRDFKDRSPLFGGPTQGPTQSSDNGQRTARPSMLLPADQSKSTKKTEASVDKLVDAADQALVEGRSVATAMDLAINMFAGSVSTFANAVDEKQAWAAWAGEVGRSGGLGKGVTSNNQAVQPGLPSTYDSIINKYSAQNGVPPELVKRVIQTESGFNQNARSEVGAEGLMQIMPANKKALGISNSFDPEQNISAGTKLLAENIKMSGGNIREALMRYHGGNNQDNWGPKTQAYPAKVLGEDRPNAGGESRSKLQLASVQANIAGRLGVPLQQLQLGGVNRDDVAWANQQLQGGIKNNIFDLQRQLQTVGLPQQTRSKIMTDLREQQSGLAMMQTYGSQVEARQQEGGRSITIGERAVIINVTGSGNPEQTAQQVANEFSDHLGEVVNGAADGMKY